MYSARRPPPPASPPTTATLHSRNKVFMDTAIDKQMRISDRLCSKLLIWKSGNLKCWDCLWMSTWLRHRYCPKWISLSSNGITPIKYEYKVISIQCYWLVSISMTCIWPLIYCNVNISNLITEWRDNNHLSKSTNGCVPFEPDQQFGLPSFRYIIKVSWDFFPIFFCNWLLWQENNQKNGFTMKESKKIFTRCQKSVSLEALNHQE